MSMKDRYQLLQESKKRVKAISFGDAVTNICAGDGNPRRHSYFVKCANKLVTCTDKKGAFWKTDIKVIYPGHIGYDESKKLYEPIWEAEFGRLA